MAIILNDNIKINAGKPAESKYLNELNIPYSGTSEVISKITPSLRYKGLTVNINGDEYWFKDGLDDVDLIFKSNGSLPSYSGERVEKSFVQASHGFSIGNVIEYSGGTFVKALAVSGRDSEILGVVNEITDANTFNLVFSGYIDGLSGLTLSPNTTYYLSSSIAGTITLIEPTATNTISKPILTTLTDNDAIVFQYREFTNVSGITGGGGGGIESTDNIAWTGLHTFIDNNFSLLDNLDGTKIAKFQASGITTSTTRTYILPNANGKLALLSDIPSGETLTFNNGLTRIGNNIVLGGSLTGDSLIDLNNNDFYVSGQTGTTTNTLKIVNNQLLSRITRDHYPTIESVHPSFNFIGNINTNISSPFHYYLDFQILTGITGGVDITFYDFTSQYIVTKTGLTSGAYYFGDNINSVEESNAIQNNTFILVVTPTNGSKLISVYGTNDVFDPTPYAPYPLLSYSNWSSTIYSLLNLGNNKLFNARQIDSKYINDISGHTFTDYVSMPRLDVDSAYISNLNTNNLKSNFSTELSGNTTIYGNLLLNTEEFSVYSPTISNNLLKVGTNTDLIIRSSLPAGHSTRIEGFTDGTLSGSLTIESGEAGGNGLLELIVHNSNLVLNTLDASNIVIPSLVSSVGETWNLIIDENGVVTSQLAPPLVNGNGTTVSGMSVNLGGELNAGITDIYGINSDIYFGGNTASVQNFNVSSDLNLNLSATDITLQAPTINIGSTLGVDVIISGDIGFVGAVYAQNYTANYTNRSLVDKEYVDTKLSGWLTGTLTGITTINSDYDINFNLNSTADFNINASASGQLIWLNYNDGISIENGFFVDETGIELFSTNGAATNAIGVGIAIPSLSSRDAAYIRAYDGANATILAFYNDTGEAVLTSLISGFEGIKYGADFSGNYTNRSLVDKEYVDSVTSGITGGSGVTDGGKGDINVSDSGATWTIGNGVVTLAKMADVATGTVFYRKTAATGVPEVQSLTTLKTDLGLNGTNSGDQTSIVGITGTSVHFNNALIGNDFMFVGDAPTIHNHSLTDITDITATASELNLLNLTGLTVGWVLRATSATTAAWGQLSGSQINNDLNWTSNVGTVTAIGVTTANGVSGTSSGGATPNLTISLGAITPISVNGIIFSGSTTPTLSVIGSSSISGTNTGDNAPNSLYSSLVSNATHTGDATGATTLTVVRLRGVSLPALGVSAGNLRYTGTGTNTWIFDTTNYLTGNEIITLSGDLSGTGTTSIAATLATTAISGKSTITSVDVINDYLMILDATDGLLKKVAPTNLGLGGGSGYTNLTQFVDQTAWRLFYSNGSGDVTELALGSDGTYLKSNGASAAPTWVTPAGSGDVTLNGIQTLTNKTISPISNIIRYPVRQQTGTTYTLQSTDENYVIEFTSSSPVTVILPNGLSTYFECNLINYGGGVITISATTSLESSGTTIERQYSGAVVKHKGSNVWSAIGALGTVPSVTKTIVFVVGNSTTLTTGEKKTTRIISPYTGTITGWKMIADQSTTTTCDIWKHTAIPTNSNSITASAKPSLTASEFGSSTTLTGWTTSVTEGDILSLEIESNNNATYISVMLTIRVNL